MTLVFASRFRFRGGKEAPPPQAGLLDDLARDYVRLVLEIGEHDEGYVDAYYGPAEWREAARANRRSLEDLP